MPIYEYICEACGESTEAMQKFSDAPLVDCERCRKTGTLRKKISRSSFALKGSGWYSTDYKKKPAPSESKNAAEPAPKPSDGASSSPAPSKDPTPKDPK